MKFSRQITLGIVFASVQLVANAGELSRCTAADGKSYSYLTREACKSPTDIRVSVRATKAIAPVAVQKPATSEIVLKVKTPLETKIEREIYEYWKPCKIVQPTKLNIVGTENQVVRYSYVLRILSDGSKAKPADCPLANSSMLQVHANQDLPKLKAGAEVEVIQEQAIR